MLRGNSFDDREVRTGIRRRDARAENIARELIRAAVGKTFTKYFPNANFQAVVQWFEIGGELKVPAHASSVEVLAQLKTIQGLFEHPHGSWRSLQGRCRAANQAPRNLSSKDSGRTNESAEARSAGILPTLESLKNRAILASLRVECRAASSIDAAGRRP